MIPTGCKALDDLFGGYIPGVINEYYGSSGTCKTTLATYVPIAKVFQHHLETKGKLDENHMFVVVDGDGGFDQLRARQIWTKMGLKADVVESHIKYYEPTTFDEQHDLLKTLPDILIDQEITPLLITFDPMVALYRGEVLRAHPKYKMSQIGTLTGKLDLQLAKLRHLAVKHNIPITISSWPGSEIGEKMGGSAPESPMIGGRAFSFVPKVIVELIGGNEMKMYSPRTVRKARLFKHRTMPADRETLFEVWDGGVKDFKEKESKSKKK